MNVFLLKISLLIAGLLPGISLCAEISSIEVTQEKNLYRLHMDATVNADINNIKKIIIDFENLPSINPYLKESKIINISEDNRSTVSMLTETCILFICYNTRHVQTFHPVKNGILYGRIIPKMSDFKSGWVRWKIKEKDSNKTFPVTQIILDTEMTPDFFIAPVIGPYQIKKKMFEIAKATINNLEEKAKIDYPH